MSFVKKIIYSLRIMEPIYPLCGGIVMTVFGIVTLMSSACHPIYELLLLPRSALPYWLFALLGLALFFLLGAGAGFLFSIPGCKKQSILPHFVFVAITVLMLCWYHILFRSLNILLALILMVIVLLLVVLAFKATFLSNPLSAIALILVLLITLHFTWLNIGLLFLN